MSTNDSCILVTGGAGYIGSHTIIELFNSGIETVISVDNYKNSSPKTYDRIENISGKKTIFYDVDLTDFNAIEKVFEKHPNISGVIHFAALKAVGESVEQPMLYYRNNLNSMLNMLELSAKFGVRSFIFSSSCTVYGQPEQFPVNESTPLLEAESPYGYTKSAGERIIKDFAAVQPQMKFVLLRYFNPVGAHPSGLIGEPQQQKPNNLMPYITMTAAGILPQLIIYGGDYPTKDGTCIRDYIHVCDIADAHVKSLSYSRDKMPDVNVEIFNLGSGNGISVLEAVKAFEEVSNTKLNYTIGPRRAGDITAIFSDSSKADRVLKWKPQYSLKEMMLTSWKWQQQVLSEK
jgi:UDP-glucose 4-epimerase